ncbi:MAG: insulinase family protein [Geobacteraceae bacterium]|nr:insulinase family protein [Geobacteraceae bacterium]
MTFPPLAFRIPAVERVVLDNGMVVHLLEDHELPLVTMQAYIRTGSIYEPEDKVGLAGLAGAALRGGGTTATPPETLDSELEFMASSIESSIGADSGTVTLTSLTKNLDRTLALFTQVMMSPAFREDRVTQAKNRAIEAIRRRNDDPQEVGDRELSRAIYAGHPLGRIPTVESVSAVTRDDLVAFHRRFFHPNNVILAVSGDFDRKGMLEKLQAAFGGWKKEEVPLPHIPQPVPGWKPAVLLVKKAIDQSVIRMGHLGIDKNNPDLHAITVMNAILGGNGFSSRLMAVIRTREGLAYNVDSSFQAGRRFPGTFEAETETKAGSTARAIGLMREIIDGMTRRPVSDAELTLARDSIINSFIFAFTNSASVANQRARLEYYGYPAGYLEEFRDRIGRVTKEDVLRVARKYLRPDALILVVVGDETKFDKPLSTFGEVREVVPE